MKLFAEFEELQNGKWCDLDYAYWLVRAMDYTFQNDPETCLSFLYDEFLNQNEFLPHYHTDNMVYLPALRQFIEDSGGPQEFDIGGH